MVFFIPGRAGMRVGLSQTPSLLPWLSAGEEGAEKDECIINCVAGFGQTVRYGGEGGRRREGHNGGRMRPPQLPPRPRL